MREKAFCIIAAVITITSVIVHAEERYTVLRGDNLSRIGIKYGIPYRDIMAANKLTHTHIFEGQVLTIPTKGQAIAPVETVLSEPPLPFDRYRSPGVSKVKAIPPPEIGIFSGEAPIAPYHPPSIAQAPEVYVKPIVKANPVSVQAPPSQARITNPVFPTYNGVSPYNNTSQATATGSIKPPVSQAKAQPKKITRGRVVPISAKKGTYIVQPGDSVRSISREFGVSFIELRSANNIMFKRLYAGQILRIPGARTAQSRSLRVSPY